jgi:uncharacterized protein YjbJ (UPF0337 family)
MNWDQVQGKWKQYSGKVREKWGKLTDSDLEMIRGQREQLVGTIQERYGIAKEAAQEQVNAFVAGLQEGNAERRAAQSDEGTPARANSRSHGEKKKAHSAGRG